MFRVYYCYCFSPYTWYTIGMSVRLCLKQKQKYERINQNRRKKKQCITLPFLWPGQDLNECMERNVRKHSFNLLKKHKLEMKFATETTKISQCLFVSVPSMSNINYSHLNCHKIYITSRQNISGILFRSIYGTSMKIVRFLN